MSTRPSQPSVSARRLRIGCLSAATVIGLFVAAGGFATVVALRQIRFETRETRGFVQDLPRSSGDTGDSAASQSATLPGKLKLDVSVAQLVVLPAEAGSPLRIDADYDPRYFELEQAFDDAVDDRWTCHVRFGPTGSAAMAVFRVKLGAVPPILRVALPRDMPIVLTGEVRGAFGAMELGGLWIESTDMKVSGGALSISFKEPLQRPMERFVVIGDKGSIEVTGLGNASPRTVDLEQRFGELDLDLRGAWVRDVEVRLGASVAGGGVWLPDNVQIDGLKGLTWSETGMDRRELSLPRMHLNVSDGIGRLLFIDTRPNSVPDGPNR